MDISSLQVPQAGRSRFSKALPTPPEFESRTQTTSRKLPDEPPAPPPPKKNSILITSPSNISLRSKAFDSPLPLLPIMAEPPRPRAQAGPITRKPVARLPTPPASVGPKTKAAKRKSSISSLLSAYSRSSSDWAQRSSHESDFTKESEPSYSPEREGLGSLPLVPPKKSVGIINDTTSDRASEVTSYTIIDSFPPPPPLKDPSRSRTPPSTVHRTDVFKDGEVESTSLSPTSVRSGSPRAGREIWRRRASSKSDASLVIAELKLPSSNGSTASTSRLPAKKTEPPSLLPPLPAKTNTQPPTQTLPSKKQQPLPPPPPPPPPQPQQSTVTLPPRTASLPGRNIRPVKQVESLDQDDKMGKFPKLAKLKGLLNRGSNDDESDEEQNRVQKARLKTSLQKNQQDELPESQHAPDVNGNTEPRPPALNDVMRQQYAPANAPTTAAAEGSFLPTTSVDTPSPSPSESGKITGAAIARRPVGAAPARNLNQQESRVEPENENTTTPDVEHSSTQTPNTLQPRNPAGSLPHPRQRQPPQRGPAPYPPSAFPSGRYGYGPTSPMGGTPRSVSTFAQPSQVIPPAVPTTGPHQTPGATGPIYQPQLSTPAPSGIGERPIRGSFSPQASPAVAPNAPFLAQPPAPNNKQDAAARDSGFDADTIEDKDATEQPMSDAAAAAITLFPGKQNWDVECTVDGVWPPNPLSERHYKCHVNHNKLLDSRNTNYPLACQTCCVADANLRFKCTFCNMRLCMSCTNLLVANGRDLRVVMTILKEQGRLREWDQYPKRRADQDS